MKASCGQCQRILTCIVSYKKEHNGNSPTLRQIGDAIELAPSGVRRHIKEHLIPAGLVRDAAYKPIELTFGKWTRTDDTTLS